MPLPFGNLAFFFLSYRTLFYSILYMYVCMYVCVCMYVYVCVCMCMYVCMYVVTFPTKSTKQNIIELRYFICMI